MNAELQTSQNTCKKLRDERDAALRAEHQAVVRASAFQQDRDVVQRLEIARIEVGVVIIV